MRNNRNKVAAAAVCGLIVGSVGTSIVGNFQANNQENLTAVNNSNSNSQLPDSSEFDQYSNDSNGTTSNNSQWSGERPERGMMGGKGNHHQGEASLDSTEGVDVENGQYTDGTYEGTASGYSSGLKVQVTISSGKISNVQVVSHNETPGFCERAIETVPAEIVSAQSTNVDTVSGATYTSVGIINAVNSALSNAQVSSGESTNTDDTTSNGDL